MEVALKNPLLLSLKTFWTFSAILMCFVSNLASAPSKSQSSFVNNLDEMRFPLES